MKYFFLMIVMALSMSIQAQDYYGAKHSVKRSSQSSDSLVGTSGNSSSSTSSSTFNYGRVSDPDGYTNIRRGPSTSSAICRRYNSGDYLYYVPESSGWSKVYSGTSSSTYMGYMHTSRIKNVNLSTPTASRPSSPTPTSNYMEQFFRHNDNKAYKVLLRAAHPSNTFRRGSVSVSGNYVDVTIYSSDFGQNDLRAKFRLKKDGAYFSSIECLDVNDFVPGPPIPANLLTALFAEILNTNEKVCQAEGYFGIKLRNMNAKTACAALLSGLLWNY